MIRRAAIAATVTLALPATSKAHTGCHTHRCFERVAMHKCSQTQPRWCVRRAIETYGLRGWRAAWMLRVPGCESGWNPNAYYPSHVAHTAAERAWVEAHDISAGLYAFKASTWATTRYGRQGHSLWSPKYAPLGAAEMLTEHRENEWSCR